MVLVPVYMVSGESNRHVLVLLGLCSKTFISWCDKEQLIYRPTNISIYVVWRLLRKQHSLRFRP